MNPREVFDTATPVDAPNAPVDLTICFRGMSSKLVEAYLLSLPVASREKLFREGLLEQYPQLGDANAVDGTREGVRVRILM